MAETPAGEMNTAARTRTFYRLLGNTKHYRLLSQRCTASVAIPTGMEARWE